MAETILILGGGWGGLTVAHHLRSRLPEEHRVVVVERSATFGMCVSHLWLMNGERRELGQVQRSMTNLIRPGIEWVHAEAEGFDPVDRSVAANGELLRGDYVVIALGAESAPDEVPGFNEAAHDLYDAAGAARLGQVLDGFDGGRIVVLVARVPFRCPAAPYEAAMLVEDLTRRRGIRDRADIALYTPEPQPMGVAGPVVGAALVAMLAERDIGYHPLHTVASIDPGARTLYFEEQDAGYDLLIGVPPHRAPALVTDAGLTDETGYVPVHPQTLEILRDPENLETQFPRVFAIGDVTSIRLLNTMLLPKAGVFAEAQAQVVAATIAAEILGEARPRQFDGHGFCYVEVGDDLAAYGSGDFFAYPGPRVTLEPPTPEARRAKLEHEQLLDAWFT